MCGTSYWTESEAHVKASVFVRFSGDQVPRIRVLSTHVLRTRVLSKKVSEWVVAYCFCVPFGVFCVKSSGRTRVIETAHMAGKDGGWERDLGVQ